MNALSCSANTEAPRRAPTVSITATTSETCSSSVAVCPGERRSEHPTPRRSIRINLENEASRSRKRAYGGTSHCRSTLLMYPGR